MLLVVCNLCQKNEKKKKPWWYMGGGTELEIRKNK
jgi:hypothetical protein